MYVVDFFSPFGVGWQSRGVVRIFFFVMGPWQNTVVFFLGRGEEVASLLPGSCHLKFYLFLL